VLGALGAATRPERRPGRAIVAYQTADRKGEAVSAMGKRRRERQRERFYDTWRDAWEVPVLLNIADAAVCAVLSDEVAFNREEIAPDKIVYEFGEGQAELLSDSIGMVIVQRLQDNKTLLDIALGSAIDLCPWPPSLSPPPKHKYLFAGIHTSLKYRGEFHPKIGLPISLLEGDGEYEVVRRGTLAQFIEFVEDQEAAGRGLAAYLGRTFRDKTEASALWLVTLEPFTEGGELCGEMRATESPGRIRVRFRVRHDMLMGIDGFWQTAAFLLREMEQRGFTEAVEQKVMAEQRVIQDTKSGKDRDRGSYNLELVSLHRQLAEAKENLRLIRERKSEYVQEEDIPLQLIKNERRTQRRIDELEQQIEELEQSTGDKPSALAEITDRSLKDILSLERAASSLQEQVQNEAKDKLADKVVSESIIPVEQQKEPLVEMPEETEESLSMEDTLSKWRQAGYSLKDILSLVSIAPDVLSLPPPSRVMSLKDILSQARIARDLQEPVTMPKTEGDEIRRSLRIQEKFPITNRYFDEESDPQAIVFEFTNRGDSTFHIREIRYSQGKLPNSALLDSYEVKNGRLIIPVDADRSVVERGQVFRVELGLLQVWKRQHIDAKAGNCGYLYIDVVCGDESTTLQYNI
jgi:hypothetical protein